MKSLLKRPRSLELKRQDPLCTNIHKNQGQDYTKKVTYTKRSDPLCTNIHKNQGQDYTQKSKSLLQITQRHFLIKIKRDNTLNCSMEYALLFLDLL